MIRKSIAVLILLALTIFIGFVIRTLAMETETPPSSLKYIPSDAKTIIRCSSQNWSELESIKNLLWNKSSSSSMQALGQYLTELDSVRLTNELVQEILQENEFYISLFESESDVEWLFSIGIKSNQISDLESFILNKYNNISTSSFNETEFKKSNINYFIRDNILYASPSESSIKKIIAQEPEYDNQLERSKAFIADGNESLNIWTYLNEVQVNEIRKTDKNLNSIMPGWCSLEPRLKNGVFQLMGYLYYEESKGSIPSTTTLQMPWNVIPSQQTSSNYTLFDSPSKFINDWKSNAEESEINSYTAAIGRIEDQCACSPEKLALNGSQYFIELNSNEKSFLILSYKEFQELIPEYSVLIKDDITEFKEFPVFSSRYPNMYTTLLHTEEDSWNKFTWIEDHLILANSEEDIRWYINQYLSGRTFHGNTSFLTLTSYFDTSNKFEISNVSESLDYVFPFDLMNDGNQFSYHSINPENSKSYFHFVEIIGEEQISETSTQSSHFTFETGSMIVSEPFLLTNHYTNEKEILIQDASNKIHYYSASGKELWSKSLESKIKGKIHQIDIYKNGKLQMLFNTEDKIYCLDRNGNSVEQYPINLPSKASSDLKIFDYDNKRKYRVVIGCADGSIRNYTTEGTATKGWNHNKVSSPISYIEHIKIKSKDYLIAVDQSDNIYILKRNGKIRIETDQKAYGKSKNFQLAVRSGLNKSKLYFIDAEGQLIGQNLNDLNNDLLVIGLTPDANFMMSDINGDKKDDFIIVDKNKVKLLDSDGAEIATFQNEKELSADLKIFKFNQVDKRIGVSTKTGDELLLIDAKGNIIDGFPKEGSYKFGISDIDKDGIFELVSTFKYGTVNIYELN